MIRQINPDIVHKISILNMDTQEGAVYFTNTFCFIDGFLVLWTGIGRAYAVLYVVLRWWPVETVLVVNSANVVCLCAESNKTGGYSIAAEARADFNGIRKHTHPSATGMADAMREAIGAAEQNAGRRIRDIAVGVPGAYTQLVTTDGPPSDREIFDDEYELIANVPLPRVAGEGIKTVSVMAARPYTELVHQTLGGLKMRAASYHSQQLEEGLYIIPSTARDHVAVLADVGYYGTDIGVFKSTAMVFSANLFVGSGHLSSDLAAVLEIEPAQAEQLRRQFVFGIEAEEGAVDYVRLDDGKLKPFEHALVGQVIHARMEEICGMINSALRDSGIELTDASQAYLTGEGFAQMQGAREYLSTMIGMPVSGLPIELTDGTTGRSPTALAILESLYAKQAGTHKRFSFTSLFRK